MPVVDVSVLSATEVTGVSAKKSFCVYVRLQGQAIRTKPSSTDREGEIIFGERFRFQYMPDNRRPGRNRMFVELWTKSLFSQACVSVAWIEMDQQRFVRGQQMRLNVRGTFEGKAATISLVVTPLDFGDAPGMQPPMSQQYPAGAPGQMQYPQPPMPYAGQSGQMQYPQQQPGQPLYNPGPAEGVPLVQPDPYSTASYYPNAAPMVAEPYSNPTCHQCEAAPLPPAPDAFVGASLPPPLYPGLSQPASQTAPPTQAYPEALPAAPEYDYDNDFPKKTKQV